MPKISNISDFLMQVRTNCINEFENLNLFSLEFRHINGIEDLGSPGECAAGPAFLLEFGKHRYVFIWDYLVLYRLNNVFIWGQSIMGTTVRSHWSHCHCSA